MRTRTRMRMGAAEMAALVFPGRPGWRATGTAIAWSPCGQARTSSERNINSLRWRELRRSAVLPTHANSPISQVLDGLGTQSRILRITSCSLRGGTGNERLAPPGPRMERGSCARLHRFAIEDVPSGRALATIWRPGKTSSGLSRGPILTAGNASAISEGGSEAAPSEAAGA